MDIQNMLIGFERTQLLFCGKHILTQVVELSTFESVHSFFPDDNIDSVKLKYRLLFDKKTLSMQVTKRKQVSEAKRRTVTSYISSNECELDTTNGTNHNRVVTNSDKRFDNTERNNYFNKPSYWLTRIVILRSLGFVYFVAFLVALHQNKQLIGKDGLLPAHKYLNNIKLKSGGINLASLIECPSILQLFDYEKQIDSILDLVASFGLTLSLYVMIHGAANSVIMLALWTLNHSLVNIGQKWYAFGWETQLLETGFLATFLCPVWDLSTLPKNTPTSRIVIWAFRWLLIRRVLGAGLIKIRGDNCWRDLTCMNYHYQTQPVPNPMSYFMHQSPDQIHFLETLSNHFIELIAPFFFLLGRSMIIVGGVIQVFFQVVLIISGNLSFLNWLTIVPCLACFDDQTLTWMFSPSVIHEVGNLQQGRNLGSRLRKVFNICLGALIVYLSLPVINNLMSSHQQMNKYYGPLRLVSSYGAFGSVTKTRTELIIQGTSSSDPNDPAADWLEYEFKCKPGNVTRRPCVISPYHYRLDWMIWVAAFQKHSSHEWIGHLVVKLLVNDEATSSLLAHNPFLGQSPPRFIRIQKYKYRYTKYKSREARAGAWWSRSYMGLYLPAVSLTTSRDIMKLYDWNI